MPAARLPFRFSPTVAPVAALFGVTPLTAHVTVDDRFTVRFGPWKLDTPLSNVRGCERSGPYSWLKVAGPAHLSFADRGVTFATTTAGGVCVRFHEPVSGIAPRGVLRHPAATVTVADPDRLLDLLDAR